MRFYKLEVIERITIQNSNHYYSLWKCKCDCGKEITARTGELTSGSRKSCGCTQFRKTLNLIGKRFGKLLVLEKVDKKWKSICDCGKETLAKTEKLNYGAKKSCGCILGKNLKPKFGKNHSGWKGCGELSGSIWNRIIQSAKKRNYEVKITIEQAWDLFLKQDRRCAVSGEEIKFAKNYKELRRALNTASLDRINSNKGYIPDNIQWVHVDVNYMKQNFIQDYFIEWCKRITEHQESQKVSLKASPRIP